MVEKQGEAQGVAHIMEELVRLVRPMAQLFAEMAARALRVNVIRRDQIINKIITPPSSVQLTLQNQLLHVVQNGLVEKCVLVRRQSITTETAE